MALKLIIKDNDRVLWKGTGKNIPDLEKDLMLAERETGRNFADLEKEFSIIKRKFK